LSNVFSKSYIVSLESSSIFSHVTEPLGD